MPLRVFAHGLCRARKHARVAVAQASRDARVASQPCFEVAPVMPWGAMRVSAALCAVRSGRSCRWRCQSLSRPR
eukprot:6206668-Pleurochrysis_carterae.AAC.2